MTRYPRSSRDCGNCYGNGCLSCGMTGRADLSDDERDEFDDAMERRAEQRADDRMMETWP